MHEPFLVTESEGPAWASLLLAHGAGAPMDSSYMQRLADALAKQGIRVLRFEFPYMAQRRTGGTKRPPNPMPVLQACFRELVAAMPEPVFVGGKSMGGRVASLLAAESAVAGALCFGYPFHPPGRPERTRVEHLRDMPTPVLVVQGTRDPLGRPEEVAQYEMSSLVEVVWLESGDHDLKPLKRSGQTQEQLIELAARAAASFLRRLAG